MELKQQFDVVVIGSGLSGFSAALTARKRGKRVAIISMHPGATALSSGSWDVGPSDGDNLPLSQCIEKDAWKNMAQDLLIDRERWFELEMFQSGVLEISSALGEFCPMAHQWDRGFVLPTSSGFWKRTYIAQQLQVGADLRSLANSRIGVIDLPSLRFSALRVIPQWIAGAAALGSTLSIQPLSVSCEGVQPDCALPHFATRLSVDAQLRSKFYQNIKKAAATEKVDFILFPPVFLHTSLFVEAKNILGLPCAEMLSTVEPTAGARLHYAIGAALEKSGIPIYLSEKNEIRVEGRHVVELFGKVGDKSLSLKAHTFVHAGGRLLGGGVRLGYRRLRETLFGLALFVDRIRGPRVFRQDLNWDNRRFEEAQVWAKLGVWVDDRWRPKDEFGEVAYTNLVACGSLLGGIDMAQTGFGLGLHGYTGRRCLLEAELS